jgi:hypothetical protein
MARISQPNFRDAVFDVRASMLRIAAVGIASLFLSLVAEPSALAESTDADSTASTASSQSSVASEGVVPTATRQAPANALSSTPYVTDEMLRNIVHEAFGSQVIITGTGGKERDGFTPEQRKVLDRRFGEASMSFCLHADGLKHQPTSIGPFGLVGLLALPMVAVAAVRDKCKM